MSTPERETPTASTAARGPVIAREEITDLLDRLKPVLSPNDFELVRSIVESYANVTGFLENRRTTIERLRQLLFGATSEKTAKLFEDAAKDASRARVRDGATTAPAKGHGRLAADDYTKAPRVKVPHQTLHRGDACPDCPRGRLYNNIEPQTLVRITGQPPLSAALWELEKLRCNLCGKIQTAKAPPEVGEKKYDAAAAATIALLKYGMGMPFNRLEGLQKNYEMPLPAATQWDIVDAAQKEVAPAHSALIELAAQGDVLHNDDTTMRVRSIDAAREKAAEEEGADEDKKKRKGTFTSGIVSIKDDRRIALFFTGRQHAGENLEDVLKARPKDAEPPIQMCDPLSANMPAALSAIVSNCLAHARRQFVDVVRGFPKECEYVLERLGEVYAVDAEARRDRLSPLDRLALHQSKSGPVMEALKTWLEDQLREKKVEPNSGLGEAIRYCVTRWDRFTLFLKKPGAPLDNNLCERALKKAILHRKNAMFYRSERGAKVGDTFMSLIHTAELSGVPAFEYLVALLSNVDAVQAEPTAWMPWNFPRARAAPT